MKRVLALAIAIVALTGTDAFASRARVSVFGTGDGGIGLINDGSLYADDAHNMFYNPSYIVGGKDWVVLEKNNGAGKAQGGFMTSMAGFHMGAYLNRPMTFYTGSVNTINAANFRPIEIFVGSDMGVKWGLSFDIGNFKESKDVSDSAMKLGLGAQISGFEPWVDFLISGKNKTAAPTKDITFSDMTFGVKYKMGDWTPYAAVRMQGNKNENTGAVAPEAKQSVFGLGIGRHMKAGEGKVMYNLGYFNKANRAANASGGGTDAGKTTTMIPVSLAGEVDLNSWFTVRGGVQYALLHQVDGVTQNDSTGARIGATIKAGGAAIDWVMGSGGATAETSADDVSLGIGQGMFSSVSLTYAW
jgi:hypothetical protein